MRIAHVQVENFRCLRSVSVPLAPITCVVGHNNAGKSSLLTAISLFVNGSRIGRHDLFDPSADAVIRVTLGGVSDEAIAELGEEHAARVRELVRDQTLNLVRRYRPDGSSTLRCVRPVPRAERYTPEGIEAALGGKRGAALRQAAAEAYPELADRLDGRTTKAAVVELIHEHVGGLPADQFEEREAPLPTGFDNSVARLLPEPILIPAVRDVTDEVKAKEAATFGKILRVMLDSIGASDRMERVTQSLADLRTLLNVTRTLAGEVKDDRLDEVRDLEGRVAGYVREQFPHVRLHLDFPPPDLKAVLGNARIMLDDGILGQVESKGDGVKRAVTFALLRCIADLRREGQRPAAGGSCRSRFLFLFEEPELYLHPQAQRVLYDALVEISGDHQVCVSTHSPFFFSPRGTGTFVRISKPATGEDGHPPASVALSVRLHDHLSCRDAFQLICYENNAAAFFCDQVVLVEGDSDLLYLKHVALVLNPEWDFDGRNVALVRTSGKGNFRRYREFFEHFGVRVDLITDLDSLVDQFGSLGELGACTAERDRLIQHIDQSLVELTATMTLTSKQARGLTDSRSFAKRYEEAMAVVRRVRDGQTPTQEDLDCLDGLLEAGLSRQRCFVLKASKELRSAKERLIHALRAHGVHVLSRGSLEDYYPAGVTGPDKPSKAIAARDLVTTREDALGCCTAVECGGEPRPELELLFEAVFR